MSRTLLLKNAKGSALVMSLLMLTVILLLATAATQMALQGEKSSRNDRDRQIAFQAAEAALADAEADIEQARAHLFGNEMAIGTALAEGECGAGEQNPLLGICRRLGEQAVPAWKQIDFVSDGAHMQSVPYGHFTGSRFQTGSGMLPSLPPRYLIESLPERLPGQTLETARYLYRITAIGFGARPLTQVALQTFYRKLP